ncbi:MAG TPA: PilZ domain-containing protein [Terriglobales bacterium]|nr:PilZ domain-containing protein [Terriglobales bacterium]
MAETSPEQRATRRFALRLPVTIKFSDGASTDAQAQTRDVSARGVFFYMDSKIEEGSPIEFTLTLPPEITLTESIRVRCRGKVVRVDQAGPGNRIGIGAVIEQYDFVSEVQ